MSEDLISNQVGTACPKQELVNLRNKSYLIYNATRTSKISQSNLGQSRRNAKCLLVKSRQTANRIDADVERD